MTQDWVDAYLRRIGAGVPGPLTVEALSQLQLAHLRAVPFENLSIHLGEPILLTPEALIEKIVERRRGGFCYELNGAFSSLLEALGYTVRLLSARVHGTSGLGPPFDHMALRVELDHPWLVDVGFGAFTQLPVRLDTDAPQSDPAGPVRIERSGEGDFDVFLNGELQYRLDQRPYALSDFAPTCWWQATSPESHFTQSLTCSLLTETGRVTLSGNRLILTENSQRHERSLGSDAEILGAYLTHFGMKLDRLPTPPAH